MTVLVVARLMKVDHRITIDYGHQITVSMRHGVKISAKGIFFKKAIKVADISDQPGFFTNLHFERVLKLSGLGS